MSERTKRQVIGMSVGILLHNGVLFLLCLLISPTIPVLSGILIGAVMAECMLFSIAQTTELCAESADGAYSSKKMAIHSLIRSLLVIALVCILWKFTSVNLLTMILGAMGLKTGAYLYPVLKKRNGGQGRKRS